MARKISAGSLTRLLSEAGERKLRHKPHYKLSTGYRTERGHLARERWQISGYYVISPPVPAMPAGYLGDLQVLPDYEQCVVGSQFPALPTYEPAAQRAMRVHICEAISPALQRSCCPALQRSCCPVEEDLDSPPDLAPFSAVQVPEVYARAGSSHWSHNSRPILFL